jgi:formylglycine-generating enzyme required for sulfatase activity
LNFAPVAAAFAFLLSTIIGCHRLLDVNVAAAPAVSLELSGDGVRDKSMVLIHGATFQMGTEPSEVAHLQQAFGIKRADLFSAEVPRHTVTIGSFYLDRYEATNAQFKKFLDKNPQWRQDRIPARYHNGNYLKQWNDNNYPKGKADHPVTNVSWYAAVAYCQWEGKRLPTEAEWEYAARGGLSGATFPWGDEPVDKTRANYSGTNIGGPAPVGSYPANGYGLFDMAGNVWEYVADEWGPYSSSPQMAPVAGGDLFLAGTFLNVTTRRVIRGGSWAGAPINLRVAYRDSHPPEGAQDFVGFRCAKSAPSGRQQ